MVGDGGIFRSFAAALDDAGAGGNAAIRIVPLASVPVGPARGRGRGCDREQRGRPNKQSQYAHDPLPCLHTITPSRKNAAGRYNRRHNRGTRGGIRGRSERGNRDRRSRCESIDKRFHDASPYLDRCRLLASAHRPIGWRLQAQRCRRLCCRPVIGITNSGRFRTIQRSCVRTATPWRGLGFACFIELSLDGQHGGREELCRSIVILGFWRASAL